MQIVIKTAIIRYAAIILPFFKAKNDHIETISFQGSGCAISTASASMMTDLLKIKL